MLGFLAKLNRHIGAPRPTIRNTEQYSNMWEFTTKLGDINYNAANVFLKEHGFNEIKPERTPGGGSNRGDFSSDTYVDMFRHPETGCVVSVSTLFANQPAKLRITISQ